MRLRPVDGRTGGYGKKLIEGGDPDANFAFYCLHKFHLLPHEYLALPQNERAFVIACILLRIEQERRQAREAQAGA